MDRNRDSRRSSTAAMNCGGGGGLSRRRQRNSNSYKESPEDGGVEPPEASRLRDRGFRKDRDGSSRRKRCRRQRLLHGNSREEGEDSSEESIDEDEDEDDDAEVRHRPENLATSSSSQHQVQPNHHNHHYNHHHHHHQQHHHQQQQQRKSFPSSVGRPPAVWTADEMIGVAVPRKARTASVKRSPEYSVSGVGGGTGGAGGREQIAREASTSPSTSQISPSSSNASIRKKMKPTSVSKQRPLKTSKSPSSAVQDDLEIEVAEVLFGLTRQFQCPAKQECHKVDSRESVAISENETKSRLPSVNPPSDLSSAPASVSAVAPKRKKPRPVKYEEESSGLPTVTTTSPFSATKMESESLTKMEASSPQNEKKVVVSATENGVSPKEVSTSLQQSACWDAKKESTEQEKPHLPDLRPTPGGSGAGNVIDNKKEAPLASKAASTMFDVNLCERRLTSKNTGSDSPREENFKINLMAPPGKLSADMDETCNFNVEQNSMGPDTDMGPRQNVEKRGEKATVLVVERVEAKVEKSVQVDLDLKIQEVKAQNSDCHLDMKKLGKDDAGSSLQVQKQQSVAAKVETKNEKCDSTTPVNVPMTVGTWSGGFPPFGYMRQVPSLQTLIPIDGAGGPSNAMEPTTFSMKPRPKRCATHCYIAQTIHHHQKLARMNPFWSAAGGTTSLYGAKPYNLNFLPTSEAAMFGNPMQGSFPGKIMSPLNEGNDAPMVAASCTSHVTKERMPPVTNAIAEASLMKQSVFQHIASSAPNMLNGPALIFPFNQQKTAAPVQTEATKSTIGVSNIVPSTGTSAPASGVSGNSGLATPVNLGFANLSSNEAQYVALLQNNPYPFPLPHVAGALPFRGINPGQTIPFFYQSNLLPSSQLHHYQQLQQPGLPQPPNAQQNLQKSSSESSSYHKHPQKSQNTVGGVGSAGTNSHGLSASYQRMHLQPQGRQQEAIRGTEDNPSAADGRASHGQKGSSGQTFTLPIHHQSFPLTSTASASPVAGNLGGHGAKQPISQLPQQEQNAKIMLTSPQVFTMPFASSNGASAAAPGIDFSSMMQNHVFFQSHLEASKQGYHQIATSASLSSQAVQQREAQLQTLEGKSVVRDSINNKVMNIEERKIIPGETAAGSSLQNSLMLTKSEGEPPVSSNPSNNVVESTSHTFSLIHAPANGSKVVSNSAATVVSTSSSAEAATVSKSTSQQQLFHLQKPPQQRCTLSQSKASVPSNNTSVYSERLPGVSALTKFPQTLTGFPQALMQGGNPTSSPQLKASTRRVAPTASPAPTPGKGSHQLQGRSAQQHISTQSHQMATSFGMNSLKMVNSGSQNLPGGSGSPSSVVAMAFASPSNSVSKNAGGSQVPAISKPGSANIAISFPQQSSSKQSSVSSSSKSLPASNMPSILVHPQNASKSISGGKQQQQQQQQPQKQQPFHQAQVFLSSTYMQQHHSLQSNMVAAAGYYQKRQSEQSQQPHQVNSIASSNGMLAISSMLAPSCVSPASDPAKAMAAAAATANGMKTPSVLQATQLVAVAQSASGSPHSLMPASFSYLSMPAESGKCTSEQNSAAGDNLHSCWQPEKK